MLCAQFICIQRALHVLVSMFWLLDCVFNCRNIAKMTLFSMQINRPSVGHSKWNPFSISVNASVLIVFRFNFIQQDFHRILSCVCVCVLFGTSLLYSVWRLFQYAAQHSFNVCNTMCTILHTPFPFFYLVVLLFFFRVLVFVLFSSTRSHLYWSVCFKAHHMHTHTRARVEVRLDPKEISNLKYIFITITQLPNFSVFSPFDERFNCADARFVTRLLCVRSGSFCVCIVVYLRLFCTHFFLCEPRLSLRFHYETDYLVLLLFLFILFFQLLESINDWIVISFFLFAIILNAIN